MRKLLTLLLMLCLALAATWMLPQPPDPVAIQPATPQPAPRGGDFTLNSSEGPLSLHDLEGRIVLLYFGYTACPDICPTNLAILSMALSDLTPEERARVQVLFVGVDPERDTPEQLRTYTGFFHPQIIGLTGTPEQIRATADLYGAIYRRVAEPQSALGYVIDHSAYTYVIDQQGQLLQRLDHATPAPHIVRVIRRLLGSGT